MATATAPPRRVLVAIILHPFLAWCGAVATGWGFAVYPLVALFGLLFTLVNAALSVGAWYAFTGFLLEASKLKVWVYAEDGGPLEVVEHETDVPSLRRDDAQSLTLFSFGSPVASRA